MFAKIHFLLDILFIYISVVIPLPSFSSTNPLSSLPTTASLRVLPHPHTHCHLTALAFSYTGASSLYRTKGLSTHWCQIRPFFATYAAGAMGPSRWTLWLVVSSLGALEVLVSLYCCSSYGVTNLFSSLGPFSSSSIGDPVLSPMDGWKHPPLYW